MVRRRLMGLLCVAALGLVWMGQASAPSSQPAAVDLGDPAAARRLLAELEDKDPAVRERGQKELDAMPAGAWKELRTLADTATDAETKARMLARVGEMQDFLCLNPTLVSLALKDASLQEVGAALGDKLGVAVGVSAFGADAKDRFTLDVKDVPFWEAVRRLNEQHRVTFYMAMGRGAALSELTNRPAGETARQIQVRQGVAVTIIGRRFPGVGLRGEPVPPSIQLTLTAAVDPRLKLAGDLGLELTSAADDAGKKLAFPQPHSVGGAVGPKPINATRSLSTSVVVDGKGPASVTIGVKVTVPCMGDDGARTVIVPFEFKDLPMVAK